MVRLVSLLSFFLFVAVASANCFGASAASESFPDRWSLVLEPPIMTEYGLGPNGPEVGKARIELRLTKTSDAISGTGGYSYSDCGLYRGGKIKGSLSKDEIKLQMRGALELDLAGKAASNGVYSGEARVLDQGAYSKRRFRLVPIKVDKRSGFQNRFQPMIGTKS